MLIFLNRFVFVNADNRVLFLFMNFSFFLNSVRSALLPFVFIARLRSCDTDINPSLVELGKR